MEITNTNDKLALINLSKFVVKEMKKTKSDGEIYCFMKETFGFSDVLLDQII